MNATLTPAGRRIRAFAKRAWIQQGTMALWLSVLIGAGYGLLVLLAPGGTETMPEMSAIIGSQTTDLAAVLGSDGKAHLMSSYMLVMAPALLGALVGIVATLTLPGVVADDVSGGGIEVLLASPIPRRNLFQAYLGAGLLLTSASWAAATLSFTAVVTLIALLTQSAVTMTMPYLMALIVLPLSMGIWSATITLFGALLYPRALESRAGMNGGPIRLLAIAPTLFAVPSVVFLDQWVLPVLGAALLTTLAASILIIHTTARRFQSTRILGN
jgi:ABC-2 type transport system permease protein